MWLTFTTIGQTKVKPNRWAVPVLVAQSSLSACEMLRRKSCNLQVMFHMFYTIPGPLGKHDGAKGADCSHFKGKRFKSVGFLNNYKAQPTEWLMPWPVVAHDTLRNCYFWSSRRFCSCREWTDSTNECGPCRDQYNCDGSLKDESNWFRSVSDFFLQNIKKSAKDYVNRVYTCLSRSQGQY